MCSCMDSVWCPVILLSGQSVHSHICVYRGGGLCDYLMGTADEVQIVLMQELGHHFWAKGKWHTSVVLSPAQNILVWIRPEQITQQTLVRHISGAHDASDLLHGLKVRWQSWTQQQWKVQINTRLSRSTAITHGWGLHGLADSRASMIQGQIRAAYVKGRLLWTLCLKLVHTMEFILKCRWRNERKSKKTRTHHHGSKRSSHQQWRQ